MDKKYIFKIVSLIDEEELECLDDLYCVACDRLFKTIGAKVTLTNNNKLLVRLSVAVSAVFTG